MKVLKKTKLSPQARKVAGASLVALVAVAAIIVVAYQATPSTANPQQAAKAAAVSQPAPAPVTNATFVKANTASGKPANGKTAALAPQIVTVTGCLEEKDAAFRLKDTDGADAPKSRSWKTLGITKHSSSLTLLDTSKKMKLGSHLGQRVSATGTIVDKEMTIKSLKVVSGACE